MVEAPSEGGGIDAVTQLFGGGAAEIGADVSSQESLITPLFTKVRRERERACACACARFAQHGGHSAHVGFRARASQVRQLGKIAVSLGQVLSSYARM